MARSKTKAEREHMSKVAALGCIVCRNKGYGNTPPELHHARYEQGMAQRASNYDVIPLCPTHHRDGKVVNGNMEYGIHSDPKDFVENYGSELELLEKVRELL